MLNQNIVNNTKHDQSQYSIIVWMTIASNEEFVADSCETEVDTALAVIKDMDSLSFGNLGVTDAFRIRI